MTIRPAVREDAPAIAALGGTEPALVRAMLGLIARGKERGRVFVATSEAGAVRGFGRCGWRSHPGEALPAGWYLQGGVVAPAARNRGVGRALVAARLGWLAAQGAAVVWSRVAVDNTAARALHARCGFVPEAEALMRYDIDQGVL